MWTGLETARLLGALSLLLVAAHGLAFVAAKLRQPRVIGEILGGLLCGPTVLGAAWPEAHGALYAPPGDAVPAVLGAVYQFGLLLLMFCSGAEVRSLLERGERRTVAGVTVVGSALPFAAALVAASMWDVTPHLGPARHESAFVLVLAIGAAVTSIPVISRIMIDLGVIDTSFARVVLAAAVLEDILLYVVLSVALGLAGAAGAEAFGLPALLGLHAASGAAAAAFHVGAALAFFAASLAAGARVFRFAVERRWNLVHRASPTGSMLVYLMLMTGAALFLGVAPMFGAFVAGLIAGRAGAQAARDVQAIRDFAFAFFVPLYFALVGLRLDLRPQHGFDLGLFVAFVALACAVKAASVYAGARLAGEPRRASVNLAVAMNARGGPAIVLASVALDAGIIDGRFYAYLVLLALVTSSLAGAWLGRALARGEALR